MAGSSTTGNPLHELVADLPAGELAEVGEHVGGAASVPPGCLLDTLDIVLTHVGRGTARAQMRVRQAHLNQRGIVQGGAVVALADAAAGWASYAALPAGRFTTLELNCNLTGKAEQGALLAATATPAHLGRRTLVLDVAVRDVERERAKPGRGLVARFSCTQLVLERA